MGNFLIIFVVVVVAVVAGGGGVGGVVWGEGTWAIYFFIRVGDAVGGCVEGHLGEGCFLVRSVVVVVYLILSPNKSNLQHLCARCGCFQPLTSDGEYPGGTASSP